MRRTRLCLVSGRRRIHRGAGTSIDPQRKIGRRSLPKDDLIQATSSIRRVGRPAPCWRSMCQSRGRSFEPVGCAAWASESLRPSTVVGDGPDGALGRGFRGRRDPCARGRWRWQDVGKRSRPTRGAWPGAFTTALMGENPAPRPSFDEVCRLGKAGLMQDVRQPYPA